MAHAGNLGAGLRQLGILHQEALQLLALELRHGSVQRLQQVRLCALDLAMHDCLWHRQHHSPAHRADISQRVLRQLPQIVVKHLPVAPRLFSVSRESLTPPSRLEHDMICSALDSIRVLLELSAAPHAQGRGRKNGDAKTMTR